jgi:hypothetical protein
MSKKKNVIDLQEVKGRKYTPRSPRIWDLEKFPGLSNLDPATVDMVEL